LGLGVVRTGDLGEVLSRDGVHWPPAVGAQMIQSSVPADRRYPAAKCAAVTTELVQIAAHLGPGFLGHVFGTVTHHCAQVAKQAGMNRAVDGNERRLTTVLESDDGRVQIGHRC
jgi:hypothetical protein